MTTPVEATRYVEGLLGSNAPHHLRAIAADGDLVGVVCVSVDAKNLSGWFWYWMTADARGRGWMKHAAATVAD